MLLVGLVGSLVVSEDCRSLCAERVGVTDVHPTNGNILVQGPVPTNAFCREVPSCTVDYVGLNAAIGAAIQRQTALPDGASSGLSEGAYARLSTVARTSAFALEDYQLASHVNLASADPDEIGALRAEWRFFGASAAAAAAKGASCNYTGSDYGSSWPAHSVWNPCRDPEPGFAHPTFSAPPGQAVSSPKLGTSHWYPYNGCPGANCTKLLPLPPRAPATPAAAQNWSFPAGANFSACVQDVVALLADSSHGKRVVYMHCGGGTDRTGSLVLGYRMRVLGQALGDAYGALLKTTEAGIAPNSPNQALAQHWCEHVLHTGEADDVLAAHCSYPPAGAPSRSSAGIVVAFIAFAGGAGAFVLWMRRRRRAHASLAKYVDDYGVEEGNEMMVGRPEQ